MAHNKLGQLFLRAARQPLQSAAQHLRGNRIPDGLNLLDEEPLRLAAVRGLTDVTAATGVEFAQVEASFSMETLKRRIVRVAKAKRRAAKVWSLQMGSCGGVLDTMLSVDPNEPQRPTSDILEGLACSLASDSVLSDTLRALAEGVQQYENTIVSCANDLSQSDQLAKAQHRRHLRRMAWYGVIGGLVGALLIVIGLHVKKRWRIRAHIASVLDRADCTAIAALDPAQLRYATGSQHAALAIMRPLCAKREVFVTLQSEVTKLLESYEGKCGMIVEAVADGKLRDKLIPLAGDNAMFFGRLAIRKLDTDDVALADDDIPCLRSRVGRKLESVYADAVLASPQSWLRASALSNRTAAILSKNAETISDHHQQLLALRAGLFARKALLSGHPELINRAIPMCNLSESFGIRRGPHCPKLLQQNISR